MSSIISFFKSFYIDNSAYKIRFDIVIKSNLVCQYVVDFEYSVFFIIKYVDLQSVRLKKTQE